MDYTCIIFGVACLLTGLLFAAGLILPYLETWKRMPADEKDTINTKPLCHHIGGVIALAGVLFLLKGLFPAFTGLRFYAAMLCWFILAGVDVWFISKSSIFKKMTPPQ